MIALILVTCFLCFLVGMIIEDRCARKVLFKELGFMPKYYERRKKARRSESVVPSDR